MTHSTQCTVTGCERTTRARTMCEMHYFRVRRHGDVRGLEPERVRQKHCNVAGCDRPHRSSGYCATHKARLARHGTTDHPKGEAAATIGVHDSLSYMGVHHRLRDRRGPARTHMCACGSPARHWAYDHTDPNPRTRPSDGLLYSLDLSRYQPMCQSCHRLLDNHHAIERQR